VKVSVIIPARNASATLAPTLRSALGQTHPPYEVLLVDDGSIDSTGAIAERFGLGVRVLRQTASGANAARRAGVESAAGEALMFLDADDLLAPNALEELAKALARRPEGVAACAWRRWEEAHGLWLSRPASCARRGAFEDALSAWLRGWHHPPCSLLWSRAAYARSGGWDPTVSINQDGALMLRALLEGAPLVRTERALAYYRRPSRGSASLSTRPLDRPLLEGKRQVLQRLAAEAARLSLARRQALAAAFAGLAGQAQAYPDLARACREDARALGGAPPVRLLSGTAHRLDVWLGQAQRRASAWIGSQTLAEAAPPSSRPSRPMGPRARVSVVIPTYNRARTLGRAIDSVLRQTMAEFE